MPIYTSDFCSTTWKHLVFVFCIGLLLSSCRPDSSIEAVDVGYDFFPHEPGDWLIYQVDSIVWDDFTSEIYTYQSQVKEVFESVFVDSEGNEALRIERYFRRNDTTQWVITDVWFANMKPGSAEKVEENVRFVKLSFPVKENKKWDGNALNYLNAENYQYNNLFQALMLNNRFFDTTLTVLHSNMSNIIEEDIRYEVYAKHVGMIKKFTKTVAKDIAQPDNIVRGVQIEYQLIDYGN
jgi:hypothetical protein